MTGEYVLAGYFGLGLVGVLAFGFSLPALTEGGDGISRSAARQTVVESEMAYCEASLPGANCACFAQKAGHIQSFEQPQIRNAYHMPRSELARGQAGGSC